MPRVQAPEDLHCGKCEACIVSEGFITCMRCKQSIDTASVRMSGKWACPKCPEYGQDPKTLAIDGEIECKFCKHKNPIQDTRVRDMVENATPTLTEHYRNTLLLELEGLKLRKKAVVSSLFNNDIERERIGLENSLAILDMGFDIDQFEEILFPRNGIPGKLPAYRGFDYFLPAKRGRGVKYIGLYLKPKDKKFSIVARTPIDEFTVFSLSDITLEGISYGKCILPLISRRVVPEIILAGDMLGVSVLVRISESYIIIRCGNNLHSANTQENERLYYSLELEPDE